MSRVPPGAVGSGSAGQEYVSPTVPIDLSDETPTSIVRAGWSIRWPGVTAKTGWIPHRNGSGRTSRLTIRYDAWTAGSSPRIQSRRSIRAGAIVAWPTVVTETTSPSIEPTSSADPHHEQVTRVPHSAEWR
jgi:hypothetical protein